MSSSRRTKIYWLCQFLGWGIHGAINLLLTLAFVPGSSSVRKQYTIIFASAAPLAILTTHCFRLFLKRRAWLRLSAAKAFLRVIVSSVVLGSIITALVSLVWLGVFGREPFRQLNWLPGVIFQWTSVVFIWTLVYFGVHYLEQYRQSEMEKLQLAVVAKESQLQGLVSQINPHFIFNCLNSLRALILENPSGAQNMVTQLAAILRYSLQSGKALTVPLGEELEIVNTYLQLEAIRFEERLAIKMEMAPETLSIQVPPMLLQSLVENGVKHGIEKLPQGGKISVTSRIEQDTLKIAVMNSGRLLDGSNSTQLGLMNATERLRLLYGDRAALVLRNDGPGSVLAEITIPVQGSTPA
ncbi:MAG TPA: histidine kinase [Candidatus Angelobacter sp.]|jgi:hypothetical protein|nr:histidine kinase [Candidatus Angelobacter sp.]